MAGMIEKALKEQDPDGLTKTTIDPTKASSSVSGYDAAQRTVDPNRETVSGQFNTLISKGNPLITGARTRAAQEANARGLVNTSMGVQAGEMAAYNAALPIAQSDAEVYNRAAELNMGATNEARMFGANAENTRQSQNLQGEQQIGLQKLQGEQQIGAIREQGAQEQALTKMKGDIEKELLTATGEQKLALLEKQGQIETELQNLKGTQSERLANIEAKNAELLQQMRGDQAEALANIEANYKTLMQTNDSAGKLYQQTQDAITNILNNDELDEPAKEAAINRQMELLQLGLNTIGKVSNLDLTSLLDFTTVTGKKEEEKKTEETTTQKETTGYNPYDPYGAGD